MPPATSAHRLRLVINGTPQALDPPPGRTLLDLLRDDLHLTGTKFGCGRGECGACTVLIDGRPVYSCLRLAVECEGAQIRTVESLGGDPPHPLVAALVEEDALQCGFCTPGQAMALVALLESTTKPTDDEILEALSGNLCRCGAYHGLIRAARRAANEIAKARRTKGR